MIFGTLGAPRELSTGHTLSNSSISVPTSTALTRVLVFGVIAVLGFTFKKRKLTVVDRIALLIFVSAFFWGAVDSHLASLKSLAGASCVVGAWAIDRVGAGRQIDLPSRTTTGV
jgi:hypothetical protein